MLTTQSHAKGLRNPSLIIIDALDSFHLSVRTETTE